MVKELDEFEYRPTFPVPTERKPQFRTAEFGDGYIQRIPKGLNHSPEEWNLEFNKVHKARAEEIRNFLESKKDGTPFIWLNMWGEKIKVVCLEWSYSFEGIDSISINAKFQEHFG